MLEADGMNIDRIDFISGYCDRWCERCAFTMRCSAFAAQVALAMCDDPREAIELAVGVPASPDGPEPVPAWLAELPDTEPSPEEQQQDEQRRRQQQRRVDASPISRTADAVMMLAHAWFEARLEEVEPAADAVLREGIEVARHDAILIGVKLRRALTGFDERDGGEDPIQNDWNGSAKVALISIERSEQAWRTIAQSTGDAAPAAIAAGLSGLRALVDQAFPDARRFVRPGFDRPGI